MDSTASTVKGAKMEKMLEMLFVIPMSVPEWTGEISMWFTLNPEYVPALNPTAITKMAMVTSFWVLPTKLREKRAKAGTNNPIIKQCLFNKLRKYFHGAGHKITQTL